VATAEPVEFIELLTGGFISDQRFNEQRAYISDFRGAGFFLGLKCRVSWGGKNNGFEAKEEFIFI
jgi:hypothetical protein